MRTPQKPRKMWDEVLVPSPAGNVVPIETPIGTDLYLVFLSWSRIFFSISASVRVSSRGHHWSASPVFRMAISTVGRGFSLWGIHRLLAHREAARKAAEGTVHHHTWTGMLNWDTQEDPGCSGQSLSGTPEGVAGTTPVTGGYRDAATSLATTGPCSLGFTSKQTLGRPHASTAPAASASPSLETGRGVYYGGGSTGSRDNSL